MKQYQAEKGITSYEDYRSSFEKYVQNQGSSSQEPDETLTNFTKLNWARSQRIHNTLQLQEKLVDKIKNLENEYDWQVITETWCGDSAQCLPVIAELAWLNPTKIHLTILLRDRNLEIMESYLTQGTRSIPQFIISDIDRRQKIAIWGPRPKLAQGILMDWKQEVPQRPWEDFEHDLHSWYAKDKTQTLQIELFTIIKNL
jgi:Thioredoxin